MKKLQEMKATELKEMAKGLQVKNWWLLKKEQLITEIEKAQQTTIEEINCIQCNSVLEGDENICPICGTDQEAPHLTALEATLMEEIPQDDFYENGLDSCLWTDTFLEGSSMGIKKGRGVISSLVKKGFIEISEPDKGREGNPTYFILTNLGKAWMTNFLSNPQPEATQEEPAIKPAEEDLVTLKELIAEAGIKGTKARRLLRNADIERPYKRWEWHTEDHKHIINQVKNLLK